MGPPPALPASEAAASAWPWMPTHTLTAHVLTHGTQRGIGSKGYYHEVAPMQNRIQAHLNGL